MKKIALIFCLTLFMTISLYSQIPNDWDINFPNDTATHIFGRGVSDPKDTQRAAELEAWKMAATSLAQGIFMDVNSVYIGGIIGNDGSIYSFGVEKNEISTRLHLTGVSRETKVKREGSKYIAYTLAYITRVEADKARIMAENEFAIERTAYAVYTYFKNNIPGLRPFSAIEDTDYHSWLVANVGILSVHGDNQVVLNQLETLVKNIFPDTIAFAANYNGEPTRFIYNTSKLESLARVLQHHGISYERENSRLIVYASPNLNNLMSIDHSRVTVAGIERFDSSFNSQNIFSRDLISQIRNASRKNVTSLSLPNINTEGEILDFIQKSNPLSRYTVIYIAESSVTQSSFIRTYAGISLEMPPLLNSECKLLVYDILLGDIVYSETLRNGIPITNGDISGSYGLLVQRLLNASVAEAISYSMEGR